MNFKSYQRKRSPQKSNLFGKVRKLMASSFEMVFHKKSNDNIIIDMTIPNKIVQDYRNGFEALCLQENLEGPAQRKQILRQAYQDQVLKKQVFKKCDEKSLDDQLKSRTKFTIRKKYKLNEENHYINQDYGFYSKERFTLFDKVERKEVQKKQESQIQKTYKKCKNSQEEKKELSNSTKSGQSDSVTHTQNKNPFLIPMTSSATCSHQKQNNSNFPITPSSNHQNSIQQQIIVPEFSCKGKEQALKMFSSTPTSDQGIFGSEFHNRDNCREARPNKRNKKDKRRIQ